MSIRLSPDDQALLDGAGGEGARAAMGLLLSYARALGAEEFVAIDSAHIDGCLYHGTSSLDFARRFVALGAQVRVSTTLNVAALDVNQPDLHFGARDLIASQRALTEAYVRLGCLPTLTCAPYQRLIRPRLGQHVAWAESNAIVFVNSVLGARTDRYGDFADLCAALTGRVPRAGLHLDKAREATLVIDVPDAAGTGLARDIYFATAGYVVGARAAGKVPLIVGLPPDTAEDDLKAFGAAGASSGALALFHAQGLTPEASWAEKVTTVDVPRIRIDATDLKKVHALLCPVASGDPVAAVCLGTPHFSLAEFHGLAAAIERAQGTSVVPVLVSTSREIAQTVRGGDLWHTLNGFGIRLVTDTCTYLAPAVPPGAGVLLTNSAKWAHYAPGNIRRRAGLLGLDACLRSAMTGRVTL